MIAYRSSASTSVDANFTIDLPMPSGVQVGDYLIAHLTYRQGSVSPVTGPAGWTLLRSDDSITDSGGVTGFIYTRIADGTEAASYTFTMHDFRAASGGIIAYSGVKTALPIDVTSEASGVSITTPTAPSITTVYAKPWLIWFLAARDNASTDTATPPAGLTQRWRANAAAPGCVSLVADLVFSGPGASGIQTGAVSPAANTVTQMLFLSPADENPDHPPIANAGPDVTTEVGASVTLDGSGSHDVDPGDVLAYAWTHISGPNGTAQLSDPTAVSPAFTPIAAGADVFRLTVTDASSNSGTDDVTVSTSPTGVRTSAAAGLGLTVAAAIPAGAQAGDVAFFAMCFRPNAAPPVMVTSGWAAVSLAQQGGSSTDVSMAVFRKRLVAGDLGTTVAASVNTLFDFYWTAQVVTVRGLHATSPQPGVINTNPLVSPFQYNNAVIGTAGTASYDYTVTSIDAAGETIAAQTTTVGGAPNTLTGSNYVQITWHPIRRATSYNLYGRSSGSMRLLATVSNANFTGVESDYRCGYNDTGAALGSQILPTQQPITLVADGLGNDIVGTPVPERLYTTYPSGKVLFFTGAQLETPAANSDVSNPGGFLPVLTAQSPDNAFVLHSALMNMPSAGDVGVHLFTPTDYAHSWAVIVMTLRQAGTNGPPTARAGFDQVAERGETVYLDGSDSYDEDGDTLGYAWVQTSGPAVRLNGANTEFPTFSMPKSAVTFRLTISDPDGLTNTDDVTISPVVGGELKVQNGSGVWISADGTVM